MNYITRNLLADEQIIYQTRKHLIIFFIPAAITLITVILYARVPTLVANIFGTKESTSFARSLVVAVVCGGPALLALATWLKEWLNYSTSIFVVTTKRLIMKEGFFIRVATDARLSTISHVVVDQPLLGQIMDYGSVIINNFGGTRDIFYQIASPNKLQQQINMQLDKIMKG